MSADRVWAEGLLVFYEVFQYLEGALDRYSHTLVGEVDIPGIRRKEAFEKVWHSFLMHWVLVTLLYSVVLIVECQKL